MKKVGIVGGIGPASTLDYYIGIVNGCMEKYGGYPLVTVDSINMTEMCGYFEQKNYDAVADLITDSIRNLMKAGAEFAAIASNTPHIIYDRIFDDSPLPLISITEATCGFISEQGYKSPLILGTKFTMESRMYEKELRRCGVEAVTLSDEDILSVHNIIFPKLENGIVIDDDKAKMLEICRRYATENGADSVILGCTEIPLMIKPGDTEIPSINTTAVHIKAIVEEMGR